MSCRWRTSIASARKVPLLADVKPFGRYVMSDVDRVGGVPVVMRALLDAGLLHGDCLTVTGRTVAENLADIDPPDPDGDILRAAASPLDTHGGITILSRLPRTRGGGRQERWRARGVVRGSCAGVRARAGGDGCVEDGTIAAGDVVVIRYEGPKGGPGMREMLMITGAIKGAGLGKDVLLITDGRFSGGTTGSVRRPRGTRGGRRGPDRHWCVTVTASASTSPTRTTRSAGR